MMVEVEEFVMSTDADPVQLNWYSPLGKGQEFRIVAVDYEKKLVELQNFDGEINEIDFDTWYEMDVELIEEPEDWSGAYDFGEIDDLGTEVTDTLPSDWSEPLQEVRQSALTSLNDTNMDYIQDEPLGEAPIEEEM